MNRFVVAVAGGLALTACSPKAETAAVPEPAKPVVAVKLYAMDCGRFHTTDAAPFSDAHDYDGQARDLVNPCYLIRHDSGDLLWDTGIPSAAASTPPPANGAFTASLAKTLEAQLADMNLTPADIEFLSFSHLHFDHTGNGNTYAQATWIVDKDERDAMFSEEARKSPDFQNYSALENAKTVLIESENDHDVFGDGSAVIVQAPGHTPGHTVLLLKTAASGNVLLAGDMWHLAEARVKRTVPLYNFDKAKTLASMDKVEALATAHNAKVIRQHVPEDFAGLPVFPAGLE
jgi:N-acyl homoserine lactone hydrolase